MIDAVGSYTLVDAIRVGRRLDELAYEWFEMPLRDQHIQAYKTLADALDIAVASGEVHTRTYQEAANYLTTGAWDIVRIDAVISGGITATKKAAALAEALGLRCEIHSFGYTLAQAANLQVMGGPTADTSNTRCRWEDTAPAWSTRSSSKPTGQSACPRSQALVWMSIGSGWTR